MGESVFSSILFFGAVLSKSLIPPLVLFHHFSVPFSKKVIQKNLLTFPCRAVASGVRQGLCLVLSSRSWPACPRCSWALPCLIARMHAGVHWGLHPGPVQLYWAWAGLVRLPAHRGHPGTCQCLPGIRPAGSLYLISHCLHAPVFPAHAAPASVYARCVPCPTKQATRSGHRPLPEVPPPGKCLHPRSASFSGSSTIPEEGSLEAAPRKCPPQSVSCP